MIIHKDVKGSTKPNAIDVTPSAVFIATNIKPYSITLDDVVVSGYQYDCTEYTKDEYITYIAKENEDKITALEEELQAAKILLGVE